MENLKVNDSVEKATQEWWPWGGGGVAVLSGMVRDDNSTYTQDKPWACGENVLCQVEGIATANKHTLSGYEGPVRCGQ